MLYVYGMANLFIPAFIITSLLLVGAKTAKGYADKFNFGIQAADFKFQNGSPVINLVTNITNPLPIAVNINALNLNILVQGVEIGTINTMPHNITVLPANSITGVNIPVAISTGGILAQFFSGGVFSNTTTPKNLTVTGSVNIHGFRVPINYTMPLPQNLLAYAQN